MLEQTALLGFISSVLTEVFKFFPYLRVNATVQAITAIVVAAVVSFVANGYTFSLTNVIATIGFALASYKALVEPVASDMGLSTQA